MTANTVAVVRRCPYCNAPAIIPVAMLKRGWTAKVLRIFAHESRCVYAEHPVGEIDLGAPAVTVYDGTPEGVCQ